MRSASPGEGKTDGADRTGAGRAVGPARRLERARAGPGARRAATAARRSPPRRCCIKEWDYYCVWPATTAWPRWSPTTATWAFCPVTWLDLRAPKATAESVMHALPLGRMALPESAERGRHRPGPPPAQARLPPHPAGAAAEHRLPGLRPRPGPQRDHRPGPAADGPDDDRHPVPPRAQGLLLQPEDQLHGGERRDRAGRPALRLRPGRAFGVLDWGRGVWTYHNVWYWGSASGLVDGVPFGFNIGYGFGDTSAPRPRTCCSTTAWPTSWTR